MQTTQTYLNAKEIAMQLGISRSGVYSLMKSSQFPNPIKLGRLSRWKAAEIADWLATRKHAQDVAHA